MKNSPQEIKEYIDSLEAELRGRLKLRSLAAQTEAARVGYEQSVANENAALINWRGMALRGVGYQGFHEWCEARAQSYTYFRLMSDAISKERLLAVQLAEQSDANLQAVVDSLRASLDATAGGEASND